MLLEPITQYDQIKKAKRIKWISYAGMATGGVFSFLGFSKFGEAQAKIDEFNSTSDGAKQLQIKNEAIELSSKSTSLYFVGVGAIVASIGTYWYASHIEQTVDFITGTKSSNPKFAFLGNQFHLQLSF